MSHQNTISGRGITLLFIVLLLKILFLGSNDKNKIDINFVKILLFPVRLIQIVLIVFRNINEIILIHNLLQSQKMHNKNISRHTQNKLNNFLIKLYKLDYKLEDFKVSVIGWKAPELNILLYQDHRGLKTKNIKFYNRKDVVKQYGKRFTNTGFIINFSLADLENTTVKLLQSDNSTTEFKINVNLRNYLSLFESTSYSNEIKQSKYAYIDNIFITPYDKYKNSQKYLYYFLFIAVQHIIDDMIYENSGVLKEESIKAFINKYPWEILEDSTYVKRNLILGNQNKIKSKNYLKIYQNELIPIKKIKLQNVVVQNANILHDGINMFVPNLSWSPSKRFISGLGKSIVFTNKPQSNSIFINNNAVSRKKINGKVYLLPTKDSTNYWHFVFDVLIPLFTESRVSKDEFQLAVSEKIHSNFINFIYKLSDVNLIYLDPLVDYEIKHCELVNSALAISDDYTDNFRIENIDISSIHNFRDFVRSNIKKQDNNHYQKILFIRKKKNNRSITNYRSFIFLMKIAGFKVIDPSLISIEDQINFSFNAQFLVIQGGAAVTNALFTSQDTKVIIITSDINKDFEGYSVFKRLSLSEVEIYPIGKQKISLARLRSGGFVAKNELIHLSYRVRINSLVRLLIKVR